MRLPLLALTAIATLALDQASKYAVVFGLDLATRGEMDVLPPYLVFRMLWNRGINFGLFPADSDLARWLLILLATAISAAVALWVRRFPNRPWLQASAGLVIGGALGNVIDRIAYGSVADFLNMSCCRIENPFSFNIADVGVFLGMVGFFLFANNPQPPSPQPPSSKPPNSKPARKTA